MPGQILFIDDEPDLRALISGELAAHGYDPIVASDGEQAVAILQNSEFDVVVTDLRMPRIGGTEVLRAVRELAPATEVVITTGYASLDVAVQCLRDGAFDFLRKPYGPDDLLAVVDRAVERRSLRAEAILYRATKTILSVAEPADLPLRVVDVALASMDICDAGLLLPGVDGALEVAHAQSVLPIFVETSMRALMVERVERQIAANPGPSLLPDGLGRDTPARSTIVYPLRARDQLLGVLCLNRMSNGRRFRTSDLSRAGILAAQAALALENMGLTRRLVSSERFAAMGQVAAGIAHEVNNPLAFIIAAVDVAEDLAKSFIGPAGDEVRACLEDAREGARRIRDIVADIRGLSRGDGSARSQIDLNDAVRSAIRLANPQAERAVIRTELGENVQIIGNTGRLCQVFLNLVVNGYRRSRGRPKARRRGRSTSRPGARAKV